MTTEQKKLTPELLAELDKRNVQPRFKGKETAEIVNTLTQEREASSAGGLRIGCWNSVRDLNLSTIIRAANNFNAEEIRIVGSRRWDRRGAVGTHNYTKVSHGVDWVTTIQEMKDAGCRIVAVECPEDDRPVSNLPDYSWARNSFLIFGEEGSTLPDEVLEMCDDIVMIPAVGSVRSLNVGVAAGIAIYDYHSKMSAQR